MSRRRTVVYFLSPWLIGFVAFLAVPLGASLYLSFTRYNGTESAQWVGLGNYRDMVADPAVRIAAGNTVWLVVVAVPVEVILSLATALALSGRRRGMAAYRAVIYLPSLLPAVATTLAFVLLLRPQTGPVDQLIGLTGHAQPLWFYNPRLAKPALLLLAVWGIGPTVIVDLAGLLAVPRSLHEVAVLEGAGPWQRFRLVTLPAMAPVITFTLVIALINAFQYFTQAYVAGSAATPTTTTLGDPLQSTLFYPLWLYEQAFINFRLGYACAMAWVLLIVTLACMTPVLLWRRRTSSGQVRA